MNRKKIGAIVALVVLLVLLFLVFTLPSSHHDRPFLAGSIKLSTNKTPINQKAPYPVIDFFEHREDIILFANASYGGSPWSSALVSFQINGPPNKYENITFSTTALTNTSGVGSVRFRVSWPIEDHFELIFGNWTVTAQTRENGKIFNDTLIFRVNWPVQILSVRIVDANRSPRFFFVKKGDVGVEITLRNNNAVPIKVSVKGTAFDNRTTPVGHFELLGLEIPPWTESTVYCRLVLSDERVIATGLATLSVSLFDEQGASYCLSASSNFFLRLGDLPVYILSEDVAVVDLLLPSNKIDVGDVVDVSTVVRNNGDEAQNLTVVLYDNEFPIATQDVVSLLPHTERTLHFAWNTTKESCGNHTLRVLAMSVPWETNLADNTSPTRSLTLSARSPPSGEGLPRTLFLILLLILLLFFVTLMAAVVYRRKKKPLDSTEYNFFFLS